MTVPRTKIGYADYSGGDANFVIGCTPESAGCANCYARALYARWGKEAQFSFVTFYEDKLKRLYRTSFEPTPDDPPFRRGMDKNPIVFVVDLGDLFHLRVTDEQIRMAAQVFTRREDVDWLILTKRARRLEAWTVQHLPQGWPPNCWVGVTVENMDTITRILNLQRTRVQGVRWLSVEPMLGRMPLSPWFLDGIDWIACGAESGPKRRDFQAGWALDLYDRCRAHRPPVAFFGKQDSALYPGQPLLLRGRTIKEWPATRLEATHV
jgi:protein gp37